MATKETIPQAEENAAVQTEATKERIAAGKRRVYIQMRLAEVQEHIKAYGAERETLVKDLSARQADKTPEANHLRHRRGYLWTRIEALRAEQKELAAERKTIGPKGGAKKKA